MKRIITVLLALLVLTTNVYAAESGDTDDVYDEMYSESGLSSLSGYLDDGTKDILQKYGIDSSEYESFLNPDIGSAFKMLLELFTGGLKEPLTAFIMALAVLLLCSIVSGMWNSRLAVNGAYIYICILSISSVVLFPLIKTITLCISVIKSAGAFMLAFVPVFAGIMVSSGHVTSAAVYQGVMLAVCNAITELSAHIIAPVISIFICVGMASALSGIEGAYRIAVQFKAAASWILGFIMTVFSGFLGIQNVVAKAADNMAIKTTKFFIGSTVPVVGGALGDALTTVTAGVGLLRSSALAWCVLVLGITFIPIIAELFLWKITMGLLSAAAQMFSVNDASRLFDICTAAVGFMVAIMLSVAVMFILSLVIIQLGGS